jgi:tetratricopeptide (TPR) repeat protein
VRMFYTTRMKTLHGLLVLSFALLKVSGAMANERLGTVVFAQSCKPSMAADFNRGVALLHDFWYEEAQRQFERIAKSDQACNMAHWGIAMSVFHQIWDRPDERAVALGQRETHLAGLHMPKTELEAGYIRSLAGFYKGAGTDYDDSVSRYAVAMGKLYAAHPNDPDAGAFYALALLAAESPSDTSLSAEHRAMAVLTPLFERYPDHPGVVHYIIHACDNPSMARDGLPAAQHYGQIAANAPHAVHMPGHIFARLGMWQEDIDANVLSVRASHEADRRQQSGAMDQFHSDDFLLYAYLQTARDGDAQAVMRDAVAALDHMAAMPGMGGHFMAGMSPYYRTKLPVFFALEMRDWDTAAKALPIDSAPPQTQMLTYWARTIAAGHLHDAQRARADLADYDQLTIQLKKGRQAYYADSTSVRIEHDEMLAWIAFAEADAESALAHMRAAAELQDKVGQGEVDIPAREMLADMLLEFQRPEEALIEYRASLILSPNRFNGLFNAGLAAERAGDVPEAKRYFATLLANTADGAQTTRPELLHAKSRQ